LSRDIKYIGKMFKKITLKNGIRLILSPKKETEAVTCLVLFKVGSRYEPKNLNGISHFIEHMMFKGTKKRPSTLAISKELDGVGAEYNAFTSKDHTGYYIKIYYKKIELAFDILSDMLMNSIFKNEEIIREKNVIIEEINMYEDNPLMFIEELFEKTLFGAHPLGRLISGEKENIKGLSRNKILDYLKKFYLPHGMLISVAGNFDVKKITKLVEKYFNLEPKKRRLPDFKEIRIEQNKPKLSVKFKETEQVQLCLGFSAYSYFHKNVYAQLILAVILGGNMSSRLFINIRERRGLAYFVKSGINIYQDTGAFVVQAGLDKKRIEEAIVAIWEELKKIKKEGVSGPELKKGKDFLEGKMVLELEDSENIAAFLAKQELLVNKIETPQEKIKKINKVSKQDIQRVAKNIIQHKKLTLALIGPFKEKKRFSDLINKLK